MNGTDRRRGTIGTITESAGWLRRNPILLGLFFLYGLFGIALELLGPLGDTLSYAGAFVLLFLNGLVHVLGARDVAGDPTELRRASATVLRRLPSLFGIAIVYVLFVSLGLVLLVVPGIYLAVRLSLAFPACVVDGRRTDASLYTSWDVARGNFAKLFGLTLVSWSLPVGAGLLAVLGSDLGRGPSLAIFAAFTALFAVVTPVVQFAYARVYLENRPTPDPWTTDGEADSESFDTDPRRPSADGVSRADRDDDR